MTDLSERAEREMAEAWGRTAAGQKGMRMSLDFVHGFWAAREYSKQREEKLSWLLQRAERYIAEHKPTEDLQYEIRAALAENGDSDNA